MANLRSTLVLGLRDNLTGRLSRITRSLGAFQRRQEAVARDSFIGRGAGQLLALGAGYVGLTQSIRGTVGAAIAFESAMADVRKVVDTSPRGFQALSDSVLEMSKRIPVAAEGLADIMASAGQAGIAVEDLTRFTELTSKAAVAFGMSAAETGDRFANLRNVFQLDQPGLRDLANAFNYLSNNMAASASQIVDFTIRASGAAQSLRLLPEQLAAVGSAMVAAGTRPETAARGLNALAVNVAAGGKKIEGAFQAMGLSFAEWKELRDENGPAAMQAMFEAMAALDPDEAAKVVTDLVGKDFSDDFGRLLTNPGLLAEAFRLMADEAERAGSVQREFQTRADTTSNKLQTLRNNLRALGIELGKTVAPAIGGLAQALTERLRGLGTATDNVVDRIRAAWTGLMEGFGPVGDGDPFAWLKESIRSLDRFLFGTRFDPMNTPHREIYRMAEESQGSIRRITETFRGLGEALRTLASGDVRNGIGELAGALGRFVEDLGALGVFGGALVVGGLGTAIGLLASSVTALVTSKFVRLGAVATAIAELVESLKGADSIRDVADALRDLSAIGWFGVGLGALWVAKQLWSVVRAARALARVGGRAGRAVRGLTPGRAASPAASSPSSQGPARPSPTSPGGSAVERFLRQIGGRVALPLLGLELGRQTRDVVDKVRQLVDSLRLSREEYVERYGLRSRKGEIPRFEPDFAARAQRSQREDYTTLSVGGFRPRDRTLDTREGVDNRHQIRRGKNAAADLPSAWSGGNTRMWWPPQHGDETPPANPQTARKAVDAVVQVAKLLGTEVGRPSEVRNQARAIAGAVADAIRSIEIIPTPRRRPGRAPTPRTRPGGPVDELTRKLRSQSGGEPSWRRDFQAMRGEVQAATEALQGLRSAFELGGGAGEDQIPVVDPDLKKPPARDKTPWAAAIPMLRRILVGGGQFNAAGFGFALVQLSNTMARLTDAVGSMLTAAPSSPQGVGDGVPDSGLDPDLPKYRAVRAAQELRRKLESAGREAGRGLERGISEGADGAVRKVQAVPNRIDGAFAGLAARLFSAGARAIGQLIAGLRSRLDALRATARQAADVVAAHFPQSPARMGPLRRLPTMGAEIVRQLAAGMAPAPAARAAAGVAGALAAGFAVPGDALAAGFAVPGDALADRASPALANTLGLEDAPAVSDPPPAPHITITIGDIHVTGAGDPQRTAEDVGREIADQVALAIRAAYSDGGL